MTKGKLKRGCGGFTLAELLVVIVIISILAGVVMFGAPWIIGEAKSTAGRAQITELCKAVDSYHAKMGKYPSSEQGLGVLITKPSDVPAGKWPDGGFWKEGGIPKDPWGNPYVYVCPGVRNTNSYDILSYGADGQEGGTGEDADIGNFSNEEK